MSFISKLSSSFQKWKSIPKNGIIFSHIQQNLKERKRQYKGDVNSTYSACTFRNWEIEKCVDFLTDTFTSFMKYSGMSTDDIHGKNVLEIGHGENTGLALQFLAHGAEKVTCVDRYYAERDKQKEIRIYQSLRSRFDGELLENYDRALNLGDNQFSYNEGRLQCHYGVGAESIQKSFGVDSFDLIYSNATMEHVRDPNRALRSLCDALAPGGMMIHTIDFKDHGMFESVGLHPLTFLTVNNLVYRLISSHCCHPNRRTIDFYRKAMIDNGMESKIYVSQIMKAYENDQIITDCAAPNIYYDPDICTYMLREYKEKLELDVDYTREHVATIDNIRPELLSRYRKLSFESLLPAAVFLVAIKPGG